MISPKYFIDSLQNRQLDFFSGVPDSLLKSVCAILLITFLHKIT
jgi:phosphonopyruvate decarboxylase